MKIYILDSNVVIVQHLDVLRLLEELVPLIGFSPGSITLIFQPRFVCV